MTGARRATPLSGIAPPNRLIRTMPRSQYVSADRLLAVLAYVAVALLLLVAADAFVRALDWGQNVRRLLVVFWVIVFPIGGFEAWRRSDRRSTPH